jgi:hypothetical protein
MLCISCRLARGLTHQSPCPAAFKTGFLDYAGAAAVHSCNAIGQIATNKKYGVMLYLAEVVAAKSSLSSRQPATAELPGSLIVLRLLFEITEGTPHLRCFSELQPL